MRKSNIGEREGDVALTIDRPTGAGGAARRWWVLAQSDQVKDAYVSAVAYDFKRQSRVAAELERRTGVIEIDYGASEIFRLQVAAGKAHKISLDINNGHFGKAFDSYDVFVTIFDDAKIAQVLQSVSFADAGDLFKAMISG